MAWDSADQRNRAIVAQGTTAFVLVGQGPVVNTHRMFGPLITPVPASVGAPPGLHLFIKRLLAKELEQRFQDAGSVLTELDKLLGSLA